jgi:hypothetical protein
MAELRLAMALIFGGFGIYLSALPEHFGGWIIVLMALLVLAPLLRYFIRLPRAR